MVIGAKRGAKYIHTSMMATSDEENCVVDMTCMQQVKVPLMDSNIVIITSRDIVHL